MRLNLSCRLRIHGLLILLLIAVTAISGCETRQVSTETDAKTRLTRLLRLYQLYVDKNKKGPADEKALREFAGKLTPQELDEFMIGSDVETMFVSSRDNQPFVIKYGIKIDVSQPSQAIAWESTGEKGNRYVALSMGYVEEYNEESFQEFSK